MERMDRFLPQTEVVHFHSLLQHHQVLQSAAEDAQLPQEFVDQLDVALDDKIDVDAGTF